MARLLTGKKVWIQGSVKKETGTDLVFWSGPFTVTKFKQFLPAGRTKWGERKVSIVDFFSDFGQRTASVASIWVKDPNKSNHPW